MNSCGYKVGKMGMKSMCLAFVFIHLAYVYEPIMHPLSIAVIKFMEGRTCTLEDVSN